MTQEEIDAIRGGADTPCVGVCNTLYVDVCQGCGRTALEDANWSIFSDDQKQAVWNRIIVFQKWRQGKGVRNGM